MDAWMSFAMWEAVVDNPPLSGFSRQSHRSSRQESIARAQGAETQLPDTMAARVPGLRPPATRDKGQGTNDDYFPRPCGQAGRLPVQSTGSRFGTGAAKYPPMNYLLRIFCPTLTSGRWRIFPRWRQAALPSTGNARSSATPILARGESAGDEGRMSPTKFPLA